MKNRLIRVVIALLAMAVVAGCSFLPTGRSRLPAADEPEPTPIPTPIVPSKPTYEVQRGTVQKQLQFTGRVAPVTEQELYFKTSGRVRKVLAKRNDKVAQGQLLADLEIEDLERQLESADLDVQRAQSRLDQATMSSEDEIKRAELNLEMAKTSLAAEKANDPAPRKAQVQADLEQAQLARDQAQAAYDEIAWRNDRAASSQAAALQQATLNYQKAKAAYDLAMQEISSQRYRVALQEDQVKLAQLALDVLKRGIDPMLDNDVKRAELNREILAAAVADAQITAPFDGEILSITLTEGREAEAYRPVVTVADPSALEVTADLQSTDMEKLAEGMPVTVSLVSRPGETLAGAIRRLPYPYGSGGASQKVEEEDKTTRVQLEGSVADAGLGMGDLVRVNVLLEQRDDTLWLPPQAIREFEGRKFVVVQDGDGQRRVDVKLGIQGEDRVEILEGLSEGQLIVGR